MSDLPVGGPPALGLQAALVGGPGAGVLVLSGEGLEVHRIQRIREDTLWEDLHLGLLDPGGGGGGGGKQRGPISKRAAMADVDRRW